MDYNPNLIKTLNDSLATLGFSSGQPTSQALEAATLGPLHVIASAALKQKIHDKATTAPRLLNSFLQLPDLGVDFLFLALNKASNFLTTTCSPQSLLTARSGTHGAAASPLLGEYWGPSLLQPQCVSWEVIPKTRGWGPCEQ